MACALCCAQAGINSWNQGRRPSLHPAATQPHRKVPSLVHLRRHMGGQRGTNNLIVAAVDPRASGPLFPPVAVTRDIGVEKDPATMPVDGATRSADRPTVSRRQLDQLFDTLSSEHNILTAQCWSSADYRQFAAPIYDHSAKAIGCCYFAGREAKTLAERGCLKLIYGSLNNHEDEAADQVVADRICDAARACSVPLMRNGKDVTDNDQDDEEYDYDDHPDLEISGFDPEEFPECKNGKWEEYEYDDNGRLTCFLLYKQYRRPEHDFEYI